MIDFSKSQDVHAQISRRADVAMVVVDEHCRVLFDTLPQARFAPEVVLSATRESLSHEFEGVVRRLVTNGAARPHDKQALVAMISSRWFVRLQLPHTSDALARGDSRFFVLTIESLRNHDELSDAVRRFSLTRREGEVLLLIMQGLNAAEIADALYLAEGTVQSYYKRLLKKTNARNRVAMVAAVLGWDATKTSGRQAR